MSIKIKRIVMEFIVNIFVDIIGIGLGYIIKCALL